MEATTINERYRVVRKLGRGGMGQVYLVEDTRLENRLLALKTIIPEETTREVIDCLYAEFRELSRLRHPNLATAYDFGRIAGSGEHFFTTAYIDGVDLLQGTERSSVDQLLDIIRQLLRGLDFIHSHGLLHNDLKPSNVLLERVAAGKDEGNRSRIAELTAVFQTGTVKIIDFGLLSAEHVAWSRIKGTLRYMSPERIRRLPADRRSDLYSLGVVLFQVCARVVPFSATDHPTLALEHLERRAPSLATFRPDLPPVFARLVERLLEKDPQKRFPSASAALSFLEEGQGQKEPLAMPSRAAPLACGDLLGRDQELEFLLACLRKVSALAAQTACVAVQGPAGVGKTRLVGELRSHVQLCGGAYISVEGKAVEGHLLPVADRVLGGLENCGASGLEELRTAVQLLASDGSRLSTILERVILDEATRMPLLVLFDDFQNASETVRRFVLELVQAAADRYEEKSGRPRLMVVISRRLETGRGDLRLSDLLTVDLSPFSPETSRDFLKKLYGQEELSEEVLETLARVSGGNPRLLMDLAQSLVDQGHVQFLGSRWVFPPSMAGIPLPASSSSFLEKRIRELDADSQRLLEWISLAQSPLSLGILRQLFRAQGTDLTERRLGNLLALLTQQGILCVDPQGLHSVQHRGVRATLVAGIERERERSMHQRLAQAMETELGEEALQSGTASVVLAHHWLESENLPAFLRYAPRAASSLQRCGNFELAVDYHRRMVEQTPDEATARKIKSLARLSEMHEFLWDLDQGRKDLESILALGGPHLSRPDRCALLRRIAGMEIARNRNVEALALLENARALLGAEGDPLQSLPLDATEAWSAWFLGDRPRARSAEERAEKTLGVLPVARGPQLAPVINARNLLANLRCQRGEFSLAEENYRRNLELLSGMNSAQAEAATHCSYGSLLLDSGRAGEAREHLSRALETAKQIGDRRTLSRARERLGQYHLLYGDLKRALQITEVALQDAEAIHHPAATAGSLCMLGRIHLRAGQFPSAAETFARALELYRGVADPIGTPAALLDLARLSIAEGNLPQARRRVAEGGGEADRHGLVLVRAAARLLEAEVLFARRGAVDSPGLEEAAAAFRSAGATLGLLDAELLSVQAAIQSGEFEDAAADLQRIDGTLKASGSREQVARSRYLKALLDSRQGRTEQAVQALLSLDQLSINWVLPRIAAECRRTLNELSVPGKPPLQPWNVPTVKN